MARRSLNVILGAALGVAAGARRAPAMTLTEAVHAAWQTSTQLTAASELSNLAGHDVQRRLYPNEPQAQLTRGDDGASASAALALTVGIPGKALALRRLDEAKAEVQRVEVLAKRHEIARTAAQTFLDCATQRALAQSQRSSLQDQDDVAQALKQMYDAGRATQADAIGAELQVRQARSDLRALTDRAGVACRKLHELVAGGTPAGATVPSSPALRSRASGIPSATAETYLLPADVDPALLAEIGPVTADELRGRAVVQLGAATAASATWSQLPDLTLSAQRNHYITPTASPSGKEWTTTYGVGVTVPLFYRSYEGAEARRVHSQAALDAGAAQQALLAAASDVDDAAQDFGRSRTRLADIHAQDLPLAEALYESAFTSYKAGKLGYADLVLARRTLADLQSQEVQLKAEIIGARLRCLDRCGALAAGQPNG